MYKLTLSPEVHQQSDIHADWQRYDNGGLVSCLWVLPVWDLSLLVSNIDVYLIVAGDDDDDGDEWLLSDLPIEHIIEHIRLKLYNYNQPLSKLYIQNFRKRFFIPAHVLGKQMQKPSRFAIWTGNPQNDAIIPCIF